jgi:N-acyl-D-aspartate/D-glutamate deacylase
MECIVLKNGWILDGAGAPAKKGNVLLAGDRIDAVSAAPLPAGGRRVIDCAGLTVAPGFIDAHSHNDWYLLSQNDRAYIEPFLHQGITTFIGGNCGFGAAGMKKHSPYKADVRNGLFSPGIDGASMPWDTWPEYFACAAKHGLLGNLAVQAGCGTSLLSVAGLAAPGPDGYSEAALDETLTLLEEGLDAGCTGVSVGLGYRPDQNLRYAFLARLARLTARKGKVFSVHRGSERNYAPPGAYPTNAIWLRDFFEALKDTGARVEISHLVFPYHNAWTSSGAVLSVIDEYREKGMDIWFDMFPYRVGASEIAIVLIPAIHALLPQIYTDKALQETMAARLRSERETIGQYASEIQLANPVVEALRPFQGMFLDEIAKARGMTEFESSLDIYRLTRGAASVYLHAHYPPGLVEELMKRPNVLFMTDAWIERGSVQNPSAYGAMPRFLRLSQKPGGIGLPEAVSRMTGKTAERFGLKNRGRVQKGCFADIVVFDAAAIHEKNDELHPETAPEGIRHVFIGGAQILQDGVLRGGQRPGRILRA